MNDKLAEQIERIKEQYKKAEKQKKIIVGWKLSGGNID